MRKDNYMAEINVTKNNFDSEIKKSNIPVLLDFWAPWCGPCRMMSPVIEEIASEYEGKVKVGKVNVDEDSELAADFNIASIPTLVLFDGGEVKNTSIGFIPKDKVSALLSDILKI